LESEILLVDEVLAVGDAQFQKKCLGKMEDISKTGRAVVFVSHNMQAIRTLCTRAILLDRGEKTCDGSVSEVINKYEDYHSNDMTTMDWKSDGPGIPGARLTKAGVLNDGKSVGPNISTEKPIQIYIDFQVERETKVGTSILLHNQEGQLLFFSDSNHEPCWHMKTRPVGIYRSVCEIPANLLTPGRYSVTIGIWEGSYEAETIERDILHFVAYDDGFIRGELPYIANYGVIAPLLKWSSLVRQDNDH
jgi:lipopolysaccharide transport system ATP-binding protein